MIHYFTFLTAFSSIPSAVEEGTWAVWDATVKGWISKEGTHNRRAILPAVHLSLTLDYLSRGKNIIEIVIFYFFKEFSPWFRDFKALYTILFTYLVKAYRKYSLNRLPSWTTHTCNKSTDIDTRNKLMNSSSNIKLPVLI